MSISPAWAVRVAALAAILANATAFSRADAAACAPDNFTEAGTCAPPVVDPPMTDYQRKQQAAKDASLAALEAGRSPAAARTQSTNPGGGGTSDGGPRYALPEVAEMDIWKEGEGNGRAHWTCGPSATRNMVAAMYRRSTGVWRDFTEQKFAEWEETTTGGTSRANVARALNAHFSGFGHWVTTRPADFDDYLAFVENDTSIYHQSVIANVDTQYYSFFNKHPLNHFDFVYGFDASDPSERFLYIGEEWDPYYIYGSSTYGNPYGHHRESLRQAFYAIAHTSTHGIVA